MKKTLKVRDMVEHLNSQLLNSDFQDLDHTDGKVFRMGICSVIEYILMSTGNYQGFRYIDLKEAIKPYAFGLDYSKLTDKVEKQVAAEVGADDSRRQYFVSHIS